MYYLKNKIEDEVIINKSRFITYLIPTKTIEEVNLELLKIKKLHYNATHHCYAYVLDKQNIQKSNDDGEPAGTAGMPILQVLLTNNLDDVLCVVVRYFGGIMLGKGGLIRAYSGAPSDALKKASFYKKALRTLYEIVVDYSSYEKINYYLNNNATIKDTSFAENVTVTFYLNDDNLNEFLDYFNHQFEVTNLGEIETTLPL
ncbi:MAG: YigZ family protein [Acholeplasmataceae bacterium]|nr:YigZ family protein [Acholeplasmataceae bacterium]